jgi:opacity protein-like surface antigen
MRKLVMAALVFGVTQGAQAADMPALRGSFSDGLAPRIVNWEGVYIGGHAGVGESDMNFAGATKDLAGGLLWGTEMEMQQSISTWPVLNKGSARGDGFGGFIGYNSQWDDVVLGVELNYLHGQFGGSQTGTMSRVFSLPSGYTDSVTYQATASQAISDMGTLRLRAGYAVGNFLPYLFGGLALGQADITKEVRVSGTQVNPNAPPPYDNIPFDLSASDVKHSRLLVGYSVGAGVDVSLLAGLFLRAEWEYLRFATPIDTSVNTVRAGLGYKF